MQKAEQSLREQLVLNPRNFTETLIRGMQILESSSLSGADCKAALLRYLQDSLNGLPWDERSTLRGVMEQAPVIIDSLCLASKGLLELNRRFRWCCYQ